MTSIINNFDNNHSDENNEAAVLRGVAEAVETPAVAVGAADAALQPPPQQPSEPPPHSAREESFDYVRRMGRGINLGNGLSAPQEGDWQPAVDESYFDDVAAAGFTSVRIPVRWDQHTTAEAPYTVDPEWLARVAQVAQWALSRGLVTILNAHGEHWLIQECSLDMEVYPRPELEARFHAIWRQVAVHFSEYPDDLCFEILNEPYFCMSKPVVDKINRDVLAIIRESNPDRYVLATGGGEPGIKIITPPIRRANGPAPQRSNDPPTPNPQRLADPTPRRPNTLPSQRPNALP
mmetsp:Transcript_97469/g.278728  ORF Transcript_97469/g.278728 Transcript_97469/m.278728 type:complete len:292 (+) Transcript_97469:61-936(+)